MKKDKTKLFLVAFITIAVLVTALVYGFIVTIKGDITIGSMIPLFIPLIVIFFMTFFIIRRYRDIKQGVPFEDERSKKVMTLAAAKAFYVSLYWLLAISWFESLFAEKLFNGEYLDASQTVGGGIAGMALFFFIFWFYYNRKAELV